MSRRRQAPSASFADGKRGRHKRRGSKETRRWEAELIQPERPPWCPRETYVALMRLRGEL